MDPSRNPYLVGRCHSCWCKRGEYKRTEVMYGNYCWYCVCYALKSLLVGRTHQGYISD
jgi:hypothetical protein